MTDIKIEHDSTVDAVLVIDDDESMRGTMVGLLRRAGFRVLDLPSPIGATKNVIAHRVSIVVLRAASGASGSNWVRTLFRSNARVRDVSVILVSDDDEHAIDELAAQTDADAIVAGSNLAELVPAVQRAGQRRARSSMLPGPG